MADFFRDLRYGLRQLWAHPRFTVAAILCIALGIGVNSAIFSFANAFLFRMPNVEEPERLVHLFVSYASGLKFGSLSYPDYVDFRDRKDCSYIRDLLKISSFWVLVGSQLNSCLYRRRENRCSAATTFLGPLRSLGSQDKSTLSAASLIAERIQSLAIRPFLSNLIRK